ncbi:DUF4240 domain-containing protein [Micromonospora arborensis]|uniref:DUF4240 domain-containing protein n=1 Tax=Micromonospora arborensis TaxID=2116518 RepID=UPI0037187D5F
MEQAVFWRIVEGARAEAGSDTERVAQVLLRRLRALTPHEIEQFEELWFQEQDELYCWPIRDAATLLLGPFDDDDFLAVQDWIVSHGRHVVRRVQADPDSLVELAPDRHNARIDWFCGLPIEAHIAATGAPFAIDGPSGPDTLLGTPADPTNETSMRQRFPNLTAYLDANRWIARPWEPYPWENAGPSGRCAI